MPSDRRSLSRRDFLVRGTQAAAGVVAAGSLISCASMDYIDWGPAPRKVIGANDRINLACIGIRSRGQSLAEGFAKLPNVFVKTVVDIDENLFAERVKKIAEIQGAAPGTQHDLRRVLDDQDIDAVTIATPNHWHALATIWACQAGKHVYVEKPVSHNIWEGRQMVAAARRYNVLVSSGFHNRSIRNVRQAMKFLHDGKLGELYMAKGLCFKPRDGIGRFPDSEVPAGVHYDLWLGPAPKRPFNKNRFHYNWHWFWDYGCGDIGNQGPHQFDLARWGMNKHEHPVKVHSAGGYYQWDSAQETPNTQTATYEYTDGKLIQFEVRGLYTNDEDGIRIGNLFFGSEGWMHLDVNTKWRTYFGRKNEPGPSSETVEEDTDPMNLAGAGGGNHFENFINALRANRRDLLTCEIEEGHISTVLPHLANISYRLGRKLTFDGDKERFVGDREANALLTRKYRKPYVVPSHV
ncbi:MAG: Gfo/Idh/MocA family oxidoreductase [Planctomycetes bacterium]|nr:Gfo/Idh/MocA family oxidoreductase [Planctomycetota bacterium]